jgi:hypothetical protein
VLEEKLSGVHGGVGLGLSLEHDKIGKKLTWRNPL